MPKPEATGVLCDACGKGELVVRQGPFGNFFACTDYPKCRNTKKIGANGEPTEPKPRSFVKKKGADEVGS
ncbi:MAG TPA: topoisomerase DNA-binding C4 zinc finger domain-containing protein [Candidatus Paceibacterota bacterium]|nr:topoisomerase DNA-binding C4 zinc finger domain-containing protein [Candidatus Paceibacterota bacterium]